MSEYIYHDEDNAPMNEQNFPPEDSYGHNPTIYQTMSEMQAMEEALPFTDSPDDGCWNCLMYDGDHCTKEWNNLDKSYYIDWRDDKEPSDSCEDWEHDSDAVWEEFFEED